MRLCIGLCVLFISGLPATGVHADEVGAVGGELAPSESVSASDALIARLESEVLRYYSGIGAEPTEEELSSALSAARDMLLADVSIQQLSAAVEEAIKGHEGADIFGRCGKGDSLWHDSVYGELRKLYFRGTILGP